MTTPSSIATPYRELILRMYREFVRYTRIYPTQRDTMLKPFRTSYADSTALEMELAHAQSRLSLLRMKTKKHQRPRPFTPPYLPNEQAPAPLSDTDMSYRGIRRYTYDATTGRVETHEHIPRATRIANNQGLTDDQYKRHFELMERFRFAGRERSVG